MGNIKLDIPDITVVVEKGNEYLSTVTPSEIYQILVNTGDNYNVVVDDPTTITVNGSGSYLTAADYASTASYALFAQSLLAGGSIAYDTISASNAYFGNLIVSQSIRANLFTGSFRGDGSQLTGVGVSGGTNQYIPLWTGTSTLSSSLLFQTGSSMLLGSTTQHTPNAPDTLGVYAGNTNSYNAISVHGTTNNYFQLNIKNFSDGANASADIVATTDSGTEVFGFINMGINGTGYVGGGDAIGGADDAYLFMAGDGDLLIGNTSDQRRVIIFNGEGSAINNARVFIDTQGFVGINTSTPTSANPEALAVQAIPESINVITARGTANSYVQFNLKNESTGVSASSDIVATANNGNENEFYIDMGINNSDYTGGFIGDANDAYLYSIGNHLHIGNASNQYVALFAGGSDVDLHNKLIISPSNLHQMTGSLSVSGSITTLPHIINNLTASFAMTASYVSGTASSWDTLANKPVGLVSSSTQINTGSFSGSFTGALIGTGSWATSASYVLPSGLPTGTVSSSTQVSYTGLSNVPTNIVSSSTQIVTLGFATTGSNTFVGNQTISGSVNITTGITGSLFGTSSQTVTASYVLPAGLPIGTVSSSTQASTWTVATASIATSASFSTTASAATSITFIPQSSSFATTASYVLASGLPSGVVSSSSQVSYTGLSNVPSGIVSSSSQINTGSFTGSFIGTHSGSTFGTASWASNAITASFAVTASYVSGAASTSTWDTISNKPSGLVSSSSQINTGSFTGSFTGALFGTASWANNAISASAATSITFTPATASYVLPSGLPIGTISSSTQVSYTSLQNIPVGIVSSSTQINTGSFSGSFVGALIGTSSWATNAITASYVLPTGLPNGVISSSAQTVASIANQNVTLGIVTSSQLLVQGNLTVIGSSSIQYVTSSQVNIGNNKIVLNASTPAVQFGGISVIDSGSGQSTGSLYWDSLNNRWVYQRESGASYNSAIIIAGPKNVGNLGQESGLTTNKIPVATGDDHIGDSQITDNGTTVSITNNLSVGTAITASIISASQITGSHFGTSSWAVSSSYVLPSGLPVGTVSSSVQINTGSFTGSFIGIHSGSLFGTSSWATNATTASAATSITFTPATASYAFTASFIDGGLY